MWKNSQLPWVVHPVFAFNHWPMTTDSDYFGIQGYPEVQQQ
jgi:hypothetical protein